jgi:abnormal spindle-like microcephaly-associated protein
LYNVQIALGALEPVDIARGIAPEDIVHGHREKTLNLIWTLISSYDGLSCLVDWKLLAADIGRVGGSTPLLSLGADDTGCSPTAVDQEELLRHWATAHANPSGLEVQNLSTSFASGKVYVAILEGFTSFLASKPRAHAGLEELLRAFGGLFSDGFVESLVQSVGVVVSKETVVCYLAVLAGRLLSWSAAAEGREGGGGESSTVVKS